MYLQIAQGLEVIIMSLKIHNLSGSELKNPTNF